MTRQHNTVKPEGDMKNLGNSFVVIVNTLNEKKLGMDSDM